MSHPSDNDRKQPKSRRAEAETPGTYGGGGGQGAPGYGGYGGYGYPGYGEASVGQRTFQDYLLILRERIWYIVAAFIVVLAATLVYTYRLTPLYESTATVQIFRRNPLVMQVQQVMDSEIRSAEDLNTQINILNSANMAERVAARLTGEDLKKFVAPFQQPDAAPPAAAGIIRGNRTIVAQRLSLFVTITFRHPDREVAATIANLYADEYLNYTSRTQVEESLKAVVELEQRANEQRKKVDDMAKGLQAYREKNNLVSLDQRKDIVTDRLKELSMMVTQGSAALQDAETKWKQVQETRTRGEDLLNLSFIASVPAVSQLQSQVAALKITLAQLGERYRSQHPKMIETAKSLSEAEQQLRQAITTSTAQVEAAYESAQKNFSQAQAALAAQETGSLSLDRYAVDYTNMEREYQVNERLLQSILARMQETSMSSSMEVQNARLIDRAVPRGGPSYPNYLYNILFGLGGGLGFGLALAFLVAFIDDRVKSSYDIESVIGLPLLSIVPKFKDPGSSVESAKVSFAPPKDPEVMEAFSTLYSGLKVRDDSKNAKSILVTSTVPGEGKSFIARNLALTFASHGEKVCLIDCDLRRPVVHRHLKLENARGIIDLCTTDATVDDVVIKDVQPNFDVIPSGGRSKSPAQNLSGNRFESALAELCKRYDRVIIDTPPVALVSDALVILPMVDGAIYSIFFNKVRRKAAQFCVQRLQEVNVPTFGAVLNGLDRNIGGYYYQHYYDKSYKQYYVTEEADDAGDTPRR
jgi:polysaccharide biosynthesis transport protein